MLISCFYVFVMNLFRINFSLNELKEDRMKRIGTLALLVTLAPASFMSWSFDQGRAVEVAFPGVGTSGLGWVGAVVAIPLAAALVYLLLRRIPVE